MSGEHSPIAADTDSSRPGVLLRAILVCDLIGSTELVERLGDRAAADLIRQHDQLARQLMQRHDGREIDKTDGFLVLFERPIEAVAFALAYQRELLGLARRTGHAIGARVGIHVGEIMAWTNASADVARGAKALEVEGLAKATAARLMTLALPGQILLSEVAFVLARRSAAELHESGTVRWLAHGRYRLKGITDPQLVHEVGETAVAPMRQPPDTAKIRRHRSPWRSRYALAGGSVLLVAAVALPAYLLSGDPGLALGKRDWVVVGDVVNVNADKRLDAVLGSAFRIGLEQSRFVNVIPDTQVRQALERMQRSPDTLINRELASEIAVREQARAVVVPLVTQYGGTLRLSAEIVDPQRGRTVWVKTSDADGPDGALKAMDRLLLSLRETLGESLAQIQTTAQPLEQVSTPNLDALRAYSQARYLSGQGEYEQAENALIHATELDPRFAAAYAFMGSVLYSQERWPEARAALERALSIEGRLTERTGIYSRALLAHFSDPRLALSLWQTHTNLYPEYATGPQNVGNVCYDLLHDLACAEAGFRQAALVTRNTLRNFTFDSLGDVLLAEDKVEESAEQYRKAYDLVPAPGTFGWASALIAAGKLDDAQRQLGEVGHQPARIEIERAMRQATLMVARDRIADAVSILGKAASQAAQLRSPNPRWRAQAALIALEAALGNQRSSRQLAARHLAEIAVAVARSDAGMGSIEQLLYASAWAARLGLASQARQALALAHQFGSLDRFPVRAQLAALVEAELALAADPTGAVARLQPPDATPELWEFHELRSRAHQALGDVKSESEELRWLTAHPGLAQTQWTDQWLGQQARQLALLNARSRLASLSTAR